MSTRGNSKLLQFTRGREEKRSASAMSKAFTSKQSHYARRSEEEAIARHANGASDNLGFPQQAAAAAAPSRFELASGHNKSGAAPLAARRVLGGRRGNGAFDLDDGSNGAWFKNSGGGNGNDHQQHQHLGQTTQHHHHASSSSAVGALADARDDDSGEPASGKRARFEELVERSRDQKAEKKVLQREREKETDQLDAAFDDIAGLIKTKTKREEAQDVFFQLGSEETRAKLAKFFEERKETKGREFVIRADTKTLVKVGGGDAAVQPIRDASKVEARQKLKEQEKAKNKSKAKQQVEAELAAAAAAAATAALPVDPRVAQLKASTGISTEDDDGFDKLMGQMLFSRKAHAGDRTVSAEDALLERFQDEAIGVDRMRQAAARVLVPEVQDTTRREWIQRGGDQVYRMGDEEKLLEDEQEGESDEDDDDDIDYDALVDEEGEDFDFDFDKPHGADKLLQAKLADKTTAKTNEKKSKTAKKAANDDDDDDDAAAAAKSSLLNPVDEALAELETALNTIITSSDASKNTSASPTKILRDALDKLHEICALRPRTAAESFRLLLLEMHNHHQTQRKPLTAFHLVVLRAATHMFPMSDISRHPVAAPLAVLLPSLMLSGPALNTSNDAAVVLFLAATMMDLLKGTARQQSTFQQQRKPFFASEPFVVLCNVLALQLPLSVLAPNGKAAQIAAPFPVLPRAAEVVLSAASSSSSSSRGAAAASSVSLIDLLRAVGGGSGKSKQQQLSAASVLTTAYQLAESYTTDFLAHSPSSPALLESCIIGFIASHVVDHNSKNSQMTRLVEVARKTITAIEGERAPLAMRTFRPRPLRQYEPLLIDDSDDASKERRVMKKELREGKKRLIRSVQATAAVERREMEHAARAEDEHRSGKLRTLMAELQDQQRIMSVVDAAKAKAKSKGKRKGLSGAPTGDPNADDGVGGGGAGGDE